jgi:hypothetical protein
MIAEKPKYGGYQAPICRAMGEKIKDAGTIGLFTF